MAQALVVPWWLATGAVVERHPNVGRDAVLRLGTLGGAEALGLDTQLGSLDPGKSADLIAVALPDGDAVDPYDLPTFLRNRPQGR